MGCREPEQGDGGQHGADGGDFAGAKLTGQTVTLQAGNDGAAGDDHRNGTHIGDRDAETRIDAGPRRTEQGVRQTETDKRKIDDGEQKLHHGLFSS